MKKILSIGILLSLLIVHNPAFGQENETVNKSVNDLIMVAAFGAGGAILGLSTLPFYAEPGDHFKNVMFGGAIGLIAGVGVVMWGQANISKDDYKTDSYNKVIPPDPYNEFRLESKNRLAMDVKLPGSNRQNLRASPIFWGYSFNF